MFWGKKKEDEREKQLKQFKYAFPSLRRPNNDDTLFEIRFLTENQHNALRIAIPPDFPTSKPVLDVVGNVSHSWLDQYKRVTGCPKLNSWNKHSFLTEVVEETLAALSFATAGPGPTSSSAGNLSNLASSSNQPYGASFPTAQPPQPSYPGPTAQPIRQNNSGSNLIQTANTQPYSAQPIAANSAVTYGATNYYNAPSNSTTYQNSSAANATNQPTSNKLETPPLLQKPAAMGGSGMKDDDFDFDKSPIPLPEIPQSFPELEKLTDTQLERLLTDEVALEKIIESQTSIEQMTILRDDMRRTNSEKTSKNVLLGEELTALQQQAQHLQTQLKESMNQYLKEYNVKTKKHITNTEDIFKELNRKNEVLDQESEKLGESFVNGEIETSSFLQQYLDQRVKYHTLNAKLLLTQSQSN